MGSRPNIVVDGAPLASTVLTLSHWPNNATPEPFRRDTSTETALAWIEGHDPRQVAGVVTNNHFDEDGLFSMFTVLDPGLAWRHRRLLADAARAGDFGEYRSREAARLFFIVEGHADPRRSPLPPETFTGPPSQRVAALYRGLLPRLPRLLAAPGGWRALWQDQEAHLAASEALVASGRAVIEEEPELDLAIVRIPQELPARPLWRYLRREEAALHPMAIHNRTRAGRLVRIQGRRVEVQYRYESWLQLTSRRPAMRVDLQPLAHWLNRRERNGRWVWEDTLEIVPRLHMPNGAPSSLLPQVILRELRHCLATLPPAWDPYHWPRRAASA
ncbi:MAG: hypothetical protein IT484_00805 [Gammaproteobacteria bacterium]|nr:hypothetical protein [Gammaproteobacteria bacterium]